MAEEEKVYVSNATNPLKKVMMCSPRYYQFNGINVITAEWMKKGDQEKNDVMVAECFLLFDGCNYRPLLFTNPLFRGLFHF